MSVESKVAQKLIAQKKTLAIAESCSGGLLTHRLTNIPGSSRFLIAGIVSYADTAKTQLLQIPSVILKRHGAVSRPVAALMAQNIRRKFRCDFGVGLTGVAGPTGGTEAKPVGLIFIAVSSARQTIARRFLFKGSRRQNKKQAADQALELLSKFLKAR